ncbi:hypothetical protein NPIL_82901, partial [Nephila pilipes]
SSENGSLSFQSISAAQSSWKSYLLSNEEWSQESDLEEIATKYLQYESFSAGTIVKNAYQSVKSKKFMSLSASQASLGTFVGAQHPALMVSSS